MQQNANKMQHLEWKPFIFLFAQILQYNLELQLHSTYLQPTARSVVWESRAVELHSIVCTVEKMRPHLGDTDQATAKYFSWLCQIFHSQLSLN